MATLIEMAAEIVSSHASTSKMTSDALVEELQKVYQTLKSMETGQPAEGTVEAKPALTVKEAFKKNEIICMICGRGGMKTLARHLNTAHGMKPGEYRKQFNIPRTQSLAAKSFSEARKKMADERGLADNLAKARAVRMAKLKNTKAVPAKSAKPAKPAKAAKVKIAKTKA